MEENISTNTIAHSFAIEPAIKSALSHLDAAGLEELLCAAVLPLIAILIGILFNRWVARRPKDSVHARVVDFVAPLLGPALAVIFVMGAGFTMRANDMHLFILPFVWKLAVAWLAIRIVGMVSSRQSAGWLIVLVIVPVTLMHLFGLWDPVTNALTAVEFNIGEAKFNAYGAVKSAAALVALFWITGFVTRATDARLRRVRSMHVSNRVLIMKIFQIVLYFIVFLIGMQVLGVNLTALSVLGGALGVGIGFGLQKIASNFISGIILLFEKSVSVDDLIELENGTRGFIRQTAARYTLIELADGREMMIPNEEFITQRITTLTHSYRRGRVEIPVLVEFTSDVDHVQKLMLEATKPCKVCLRDPAPTCYLTGFGDNGLQFSLYFWVEDIAAGTNAPRHQILKEMLRLFREGGVIIAYPHQVAVADAALCQTPLNTEAPQEVEKPKKKKPTKDAKDS